MSRQASGLVPSGYVALKDLTERITAAIYGDWLIAPATVTREPGKVYVYDFGEGPEELWDEVVTVTRAGHSIPKEVDDILRKNSQEHLREPLSDGRIGAMGVHPRTGVLCAIPRSYWENPNSALESGKYDSAAEVPGCEGGVIFISERKADEFLDWLKAAWVGRFDDKYWGLLQVIGWALTGDPELVRWAHPRPNRMFFEDFARNPVDEVGLLDRMDSNWPVRVGFDDVTEQLLKALRNGTFTATGKYQGMGNRKEVPEAFWLDVANFHFDGAIALAAIDEKISLSGAFWSDLFFPAKSIRDIWPSTLSFVTAKIDEASGDNLVGATMASRTDLRKRSDALDYSRVVKLMRELILEEGISIPAAAERVENDIPHRNGSMESRRTAAARAYRYEFQKELLESGTVIRTLPKTL